MALCWWLLTTSASFYPKHTRSWTPSIVCFLWFALYGCVIRQPSLGFLLQIYYVRFGHISRTARTISIVVPVIKSPRFRLSDNTWVYYGPSHGHITIHCSMDIGIIYCILAIAQEPWHRSLLCYPQSKALIGGLSTSCVLAKFRGAVDPLRIIPWGCASCLKFCSYLRIRGTDHHQVRRVQKASMQASKRHICSLNSVVPLGCYLTNDSHHYVNCMWWGYKRSKWLMPKDIINWRCSGSYDKIVKRHLMWSKEWCISKSERTNLTESLQKSRPELEHSHVGMLQILLGTWMIEEWNQRLDFRQDSIWYDTSTKSWAKERQ